MTDRRSMPKPARTVPAIETRRILLGFMSEQDAVRKLQSSRTVGNPVDPLDRPAADTESTDVETAYTELWKDAKDSIGSPNPFESSDVELEDVPAADGVEDHIDAFVNGPHAQASLVGDRPEDSWDIKMVPIEHLVSFQPSITKTAYRDDVPSATGGIVDLLEYALPVDNAPLVEDQQIRDDYFRGWQFVTRSPNVHVKGPYQSRPDTDDTVFATVTFELKADPNFVYVTHFEDRYILKNGYHRTYQLMQAGETHVPAVVLEARTYKDTGGARSRFFDRDVVMGDRPPMLPDYDTPVAVDIERRAKNRVVRIIAETTDILR